MRTSQLANLVGYSGTHVRRLAIAGDVPGLRTTKGGHYWFKDSAKLQSWIAQRKMGVLGSSVQSLASPVSPISAPLEQLDDRQLEAMLEQLQPTVELEARIRRLLTVRSRSVPSQPRPERSPKPAEEQPGEWRVW